MPICDGTPDCSADDDSDHQRHKDHQHRHEDRPALPTITDHVAERPAQGSGNYQNGQHLQKVRQRRRVFIRMRRVHVEVSTAVCAELLNRDL